MPSDATPPLLLLTERRLDAGADEALHVHLRADESLLVLAGLVLVDVEGRRSVLTAGDATSIGAGVVHSVAPLRGAATVMLAHQPADQVRPADLAVEAWPVMDGLGTMLLGPDRSSAGRQAAARASGATPPDRPPTSPTAPSRSPS